MRSAWLSAALLCVIAGAAAAAPVRVISLVPAVTEMLVEIGAADRLVAVGSFDKLPPGRATLPRVGALLDPDVERILSLRPDLVAIYATQEELREQLQAAHVPLFEYQHGGLADIPRTIRSLGRTLGLTTRAEQVASTIERRIADVRRGIAGRPRPRTLLVFTRQPGSLRGIYASGGIGFLHDMLDAAGGENVFGDVRRESVQATTEMILVRNPEVIVELRLEPEAGVDPSAWQDLGAVTAVRRGAVHVVEGDAIVVPGPRVAEGIEILAEVLGK